MDFHRLDGSDAYLLQLKRHADERGDFMRTWCIDEFAQAGLPFTPVQANMSSTRLQGTVRGMHFQRPPMAEAKVVRCSRGRILDVVIDLRPGSPRRYESFAIELSGDGAAALYVPAGFAHGYQTLTDDVTVDYLMDERFAPALADGCRYDDPAINITWPLPVSCISDKDRSWPLLAERRDWPTADTTAGDDGRLPVDA
ncbi:MAG: dTDP-4-dehydrorhamnose 3,5-epimerase family protein [Dongiaceae bacterium]